jgi:1-piperideine-2-carboxylate/1-pyrroline-2-carboxylate reductase [NAD(P)H]
LYLEASIRLLKTIEFKANLHSRNLSLYLEQDLSVANRYFNQLKACDAEQTAQLLPFHALVDAIEKAAIEFEAGLIQSPTRMAVPMGSGGTLLSMPATAHDIAIHKLVSVQPQNLNLNLPTIHGIVTVCDAATGRPLLLLDGSTVTGRRTAAVSMIAARTLLGGDPESLMLIGTGVQAAHHVEALHALFPRSQVWIRGLNFTNSLQFCESMRARHARLSPCPAEIPDDVDAVLTVTTSTEPVYDERPIVGRVVIGIGAFKPEMAEIGKRTLAGGEIYADDPAGAEHEAGDLIRAGVDWTKVRSLGWLLRNRPCGVGSAVFKSVGTAAWDLAASRVALSNFSN